MTADGHIALVGDSIFDNASYVPGGPPVIEQLRKALALGWRASLRAVDGASAKDVAYQLAELPGDTSHVFISAGGNDALNEGSILGMKVETVADAQAVVGHVQRRFHHDYSAMTDEALRTGLRIVLCTIYDAIPELPEAARVGLTAFNDVILRCAFRVHVPVVDLRVVCAEAGDYSSLSPIEPSAQGGEKIARVIAVVASTHDFSSGQCVVYP